MIFSLSAVGPTARFAAAFGGAKGGGTAAMLATQTFGGGKAKVKSKEAKVKCGAGNPKVNSEH
ncbi:exported hypothetical protein [Syntrophobacter sp. SbD1]|nr:exported hypothetical protein [Syntrophobacter sp. SbD1]